MTILILCREYDLCNLLAEYSQSLRRRGITLICSKPGFPFNGTLDDLLRECPERPDLILHPESGLPLLPWGLTQTEIPTACFQVDTYAYTRRRIAWSMLFDHAVLFHPGYDAAFREAGHPRPLVLPHAVEPSWFGGIGRERIFEVGWVGQAKGSFYRRRREFLPELARRFVMNDWRRSYLPADMAGVYLQSKLVVNIGRDDYPRDANLRTFEAMAAGALLVTSLPSELMRLGFEEGVHFVGHRKFSEVPRIIRRYLADEPARRKIAEAGRGKVLREHTYDCRVETLLERLAQDHGRLFAPARRWQEARVRLTYLDYFAAHGALDCAAAELRAIARHSVKEAATGAALLARAWARQWRSQLRSGR